MAESPFTGVSTTSAASLQAQADQAARIAQDLAEQAAAARRAELEASRPKEPPVEAGLPEFVMFSRYQSGRVYTYAAIGWVEGRGRQPEGTEPPVAERMGRYGKVLGTETP